MSLLFQVLLRPRRAVLSIKAMPQWLIPFLVLAGASIMITFLQHTRVVQLTLDHLPSSATFEDKMVVKQALDENLIIRCAFLPIRLFIGWAAFALILFYTCKTWSTLEAVRFQLIFSLEVTSESIMVLGRIATLMYGAGAETSFLKTPLGLDMMFSQFQDVIIQMSLNSVNIFSLWYVGVLTLGISILYGISGTKSLISVVAVWSVTVLSNISIVYLLQSTLHLRL